MYQIKIQSDILYQFKNINVFKRDFYEKNYKSIIYNISNINFLTSSVFATQKWWDN